MNLARWIATFGGVGFLKPGPGTWASAAALALAPLLQHVGGQAAFAIASALALAAGLWASGRYAAEAGAKDPSEVVIDEVAGLWLVFALVPLTPVGAGLGFLLFRLFDIAKPWPISWANTRVVGAFGIMLDDLLAGLAAACVLWPFQTYVLN